MKKEIKEEIILFIDFETKSFADITTVGAYNYAFDKTTEPIMAAFWFSDETKHKINLWQPGQPIPAKLKNHKGPIVAHNYKFEYYIIQACFVKKGLLPVHYNDLSRYRCTASTARRCGLPGKLAVLSKVLNIKNKKLSDEGSALIKKYSIPKTDKTTGKKYFETISKKDLDLWRAYNVMDVKAMIEIYNLLPKLHDDKFQNLVYEMDKRTSYAGVKIDRGLVENLVQVYEFYQVKAMDEAGKLAGRVGLKANDTLTIKSPQGFTKWVNEKLRGEYTIDNAQQFTLSTLENNLRNNTDLDLSMNDAKEIIKAIKLRRALSAAAPKKLFAMLEYSDSKGVCRDSTAFYGAHTGRDAGRGFQPQNLPRASSKEFEKDVQLLIDRKVKAEDAPDLINTLLRQCIIPRNGKTFLIGDFAAIEAKIVFWLAGCERGLQYYRQGKDIYKETAATIFKKDVEKVASVERSLGKKAILGLGYGMGVDRFIASCLQDGIDVNPQLAQMIVTTYRTTYKEVTKMWYELEKCFIEAMQSKASKYVFPYGQINFRLSGRSLQVTLPSGRVLYYFKPRLENGKFTYDNPQDKVVVMWGGMMCENLVQSIACDLMMQACITAEQKKLNPLLRIHDEIICEIPARSADKGLQIFKEIMTATLPWAQGLPTGAECVVSDRYRKI